MDRVGDRDGLEGEETAGLPHLAGSESQLPY